MDKIEIEIHDMSEKIYELQKKSEHLTNGQRYAAINEIEKCIAPLRKDLHNLELNMYEQGADRERIKEQINNLLNQLSDLENCKSDLTARINTETESTRQQLNDMIVNLILVEQIQDGGQSLDSGVSGDGYYDDTQDQQDGGMFVIAHDLLVAAGQQHGS